MHQAGIMFYVIFLFGDAGHHILVRFALGREFDLVARLHALQQLWRGLVNQDHGRQAEIGNSAVLDGDFSGALRRTLKPRLPVPAPCTPLRLPLPRLPNPRPAC
jgi:hypothetical protein